MFTSNWLHLYIPHLCTQWNNRNQPIYVTHSALNTCSPLFIRRRIISFNIQGTILKCQGFPWTPVFPLPHLYVHMGMWAVQCIYFPCSPGTPVRAGDSFRVPVMLPDSIQAAGEKEPGTSLRLQESSTRVPAATEVWIMTTELWPCRSKTST